MKNYYSSGDRIDVVAPRDLASGEAFRIGKLFGVAAVAALTGATLTMVREGEFTLPKHAGDVVAVGDDLYWDDNTHELTKTAAGNLYAGVATSVAAAPDAAVRVVIEEFRPVG